MKMLVAKQNSDGRWEKVTVMRELQGHLQYPKYMRGQLLGGFAKSAYAYLTNDRRANCIDYQYGTSPVYRFSLF